MKYHSSFAIAAAICLVACAVKNTPVKPPETFEQMLVRTEGVSCADITYHDYSPAPDCRRLYEAFARGRDRVATRITPKAREIKMSAFSFYRPQQFWVEDKPYPLIKSGAGEGDPNYYVRGTTSLIGGIYLVYAYEECIEHEATHGITMLVEPWLRKPEDIAADPGVAPPAAPFQSIWEITCHNTPDDPVGDGPAGFRGDCAQPYAGPARPL